MRPRENLRVLADAEELLAAARTTVLSAAREAVGARGRFDLALSGGSTPRGLYAALARLGPAQDFARWHVWFGDERCVPPEHADSNFRMAASTGLLARLPPEQVHRLRGEAPDAAAEAARYAAELGAELGHPPRLDLVLLGLGSDGHTASLFPGTPALEACTWVTVGQAPTPPRARLTLTFATLAEARVLVFLVSGADKAAALASALSDSATPLVPARRVLPRDGELLWLVESAAHSPSSTRVHAPK